MSRQGEADLWEAIVTLVVPGAGQILAGRTWKGVTIFICCMLGILCWLSIVVDMSTFSTLALRDWFVYYVEPGSFSGWTMLFAALVLWVLGFVDYELSTRSRPPGRGNAGTGRWTSLGWRRRALVYLVVILEVLLLIGSCVEGPDRRARDLAARAADRAAERGRKQQREEKTVPVK